MLGALVVFGRPADAGALEDAFKRRTPGSTVTVDHGAWTDLLRAYVHTDAEGLNRVRYGRFKAEARDKLSAYIARLEATDVAALDGAEQFAFWANLYNAKTIAIVLDKYPVASIKDISLGGGLVAAIKGGPWQAKVTRVGGHDLSLDDIEHVILRGLFKDPRVHYAVNCASVGCPNLLAEAFTGAKLEAQLDAAAAAFINSPRGVRVADGGLVLSSIYSWFQADFGASEQGVVAHLMRYAAPPLKARLAAGSGGIDYAYDWRLNDSDAATADRRRKP